MELKAEHLYKSYKKKMPYRMSAFLSKEEFMDC